MIIKASGFSLKGPRKTNQDAIFWRVGGKGFVRAIGAVADGIGGSKGGEIASREAIAGLDKILLANISSVEEIKSWLITHLENVKKRLQKIAKADPSLENMGTTITIACILSNSKLLIMNMGDSRSYLWKEERLIQLTKDHILAAEQKEELFPGFLENYGHFLSRALTAFGKDLPDFFCYTLCEKGNIVLLVTDGIYKSISKNEMEEIIKECSSVVEIAEKISESAIEAGSRDNASVVVFEIGNVLEHRRSWWNRIFGLLK